MKYLFKNSTLNYLTQFILYCFLNIYLTTMYFPNNYFSKIKTYCQISYIHIVYHQITSKLISSHSSLKVLSF